MDLETKEALLKVENALSEYDDLNAIIFEEDTSTSQLAADALGVHVEQIAKSLCFLGDGEPFLVVSVGGRKINNKKLAQQLNCKKARFADEQTVRDCTGFSPGGVCPFGLKTNVPIYMDESLYEYDIVYTAAGTSNSALPITPKRLQEITQAKLLAVSEK